MYGSQGPLIRWGKSSISPKENTHGRSSIGTGAKDQAALERENELALHVRATPNTGATPEDLIEVFHQVSEFSNAPSH